MVEYALKLIAELGYDRDNYDFDQMTFGQVQELINELEDELRG